MKGFLSKIKLSAIKKKNFFAKTENLYILFVLLFGLVMVFFNPPFDGVPDEHSHYLKAWSFSGGEFLCSSEINVPSNAYDLPNAIEKVSVKGDLEPKTVVRSLKANLFIGMNGSTVSVPSVICGASPVGYVPQIIAFIFAKTFSLSALFGFYLARLLNLLFSAFLVYFAIRIIPFGKMVLLMIALLPMTLQQFSSLSYDPLHIATALLFIACILKSAHEKDRRVDWRTIVLLFSLSILGLNIKMGYILLTFLIFMLPKSKFSKKQNYWLFTIGFVFLNLVTFAILYKLYFGTGVAPSIGGSVNPAMQLSYIFTNPIDFLSLMFNQVYYSFNFYFETFLYKTGWLRVSMSGRWYVFLVIGIFVAMKSESEKVFLSLRQRLILFAVFFMCFILVFAGMYLTWNELGAEAINGVQGRYLLAISPLLIFSFYKADFAQIYKSVAKNRLVVFVLFFITVYALVFFNMYKIYYDKSPDPKAEEILQLEE